MLLLAINISLFTANATVINIPTDYPTIQQGINNATNGDTVLIQPGAYVENINFNGKNIVVASLFLTTNDTAYISTTVISGSPTANLDKSVVTFENNETASAKLIGLTLQNGGGNYRQLGFDWVFYGGGVYCNHASPTLSHLIIKNNTAECGGGILLYYSNAVIKNCFIRNNSCNSIASAAPNAGGAIVIWNCQNAIIQNNRIHNNTTARAGGAFYSLTSTCNIVNCLITNNHSMIIGSAFYADSWSNMNISNCTVSGNLCDDGIGLVLKSMMYCLDSANVKINNSIFYNNQPTTIVCQFNYSRNEVTVSHSDFEGGIDSIFTNNNGNNVTVNWLNGNINVNPLFVNAGLNDFHMQPSSPCINTGDTTGVNGIPSTDLDSNNRFYGIIDMGCYEFQGTPTGINSHITEQQIQVYPNPTNDFIIFENKTNNSQDLNITLYNLNGSVAYSQKIISGQSITKLPVLNLSNGVYFLRWTDGQNTDGKNIIVAH